MPNLYDIAYGISLGISAPYWALRPSSRTKVLTALKERMGHEVPTVPQGMRGTVMIHAVSLGEMNATRALVQKLRIMRPGLQFVISSTTTTGFARGQELYGSDGDVGVIHYPLDFSKAVLRVLDAVKPDVVVLMELEVWPNFVKQCFDRDIPVLLANARLTPSSFRNYKLGKMFLRPTFDRLTLVAAQEHTYADRFLALGVPPHRVVITGTMKFDNASLAPASPQVRQRAADLGVDLERELVWVCGSTGPGEEEIVLRVYEKLLAKFPRLRLVLVPRHPQRFDEVRYLIEDSGYYCMRLSESDRIAPPLNPALPPIILIDAMGVLRDFYSIANVIFVGRSLVDLGPRQHGSDMIEPAALGKPVIVGPYTANFAEAMNRFRAGNAMLEVEDEEGLEQSVAVLLSTPAEAAAMGTRAANVVQHEKGATERHARVILQILATKRGEPPESLRPAAPITIVAKPRVKIEIFGQPRVQRLA
jgi:3-deoxy-D-manno-octulosonic-acid transferase